MQEHDETTELSAHPPVRPNDAPVSVPSRQVHRGTTIAPQGGAATCGCGGAVDLSPNGNDAASYVYAIGRIEARFPNLAAEKEFAQVTGRTETAWKTDRQTFHAVLSKRENRYLVRQLCWVLTIQGMDTYLLVPRDPADVDLLVDALRSAPSPYDIDVVIGLRGPVAPALSVTCMIRLNSSSAAGANCAAVVFSGLGMALMRVSRSNE